MENEREEKKKKRPGPTQRIGLYGHRAAAKLDSARLGLARLSSADQLIVAAVIHLIRHL